MFGLTTFSANNAPSKSSLIEAVKDPNTHDKFCVWIRGEVFYKGQRAAAVVDVSAGRTIGMTVLLNREVHLVVDDEDIPTTIIVPTDKPLYGVVDLYTYIPSEMGSRSSFKLGKS